MFYCDTNPKVDFYLGVGTNLGFCLGTDAYFDINLNALGFGDTDETFGNDPDNGLGITTPFKCNAGLDTELSIGGVSSDIETNLCIYLYDDLGINIAFDSTI